MIIEVPSDEKSKIIELYPPLEIEPRAKDRPFCFNCFHRIYVSEEERIVECKSCGRVIDAFDYLLKWAKDGARRMDNLTVLDADIKRKSAELESLKSSIASARASLRKIEPGHPDALTAAGKWRAQIKKTA